MTSNSMSVFRRYSKPIFAVLGVICMLTFVLSSGLGRGDLLTQIGESLGRGGSSALATVNGKKYSPQDIGEIQLQRSIADKFMREAVRQSNVNATRRAREGLGKLDPNLRQMVQQNVIEARESGNQQAFQQYLQLATFLEGMIGRSIAEAQKDGKKEQEQAAQAVANLIRMDRQMLRKQVAQGDGYFGGRLDSLEDTVNFIVWRDQAAALGIIYSDSDAMAGVLYECAGQLENSSEIEKAMRENVRGFTQEALLHALAEEFRVRSAQAALTGTAELTATAMPLVLTPEESWDLFRDARTQVKLYVMPLAAESYVGDVKATPTEAELKELFAKHKADEPNPAREAPGFKEPQKAKIGWAETSPELPFYRLFGKQAGPVMAAMLQLGAANGGADAGLGWALPQQVSAASNFLFDYRVDQAYRDYQDRTLPWSDGTGTGSRSGLHDTSVVQPETYASLLAAAAGTVTGVPVLAAPLAAEGVAVEREVRDRIALGVGTLLAASATDTGAAAAAAHALAATPKPLPFDAIKPVLQEQVLTDLRETAFQRDLFLFTSQAAIKQADKDKDALKAFVGEWVAYRGLPHGESTEARNLFTLAADPGLAPLVAPLRKLVKDAPLADLVLGNYLIQSNQRFPSARGDLFVPLVDNNIREGNRQFVRWKTADEPAKTPTFEQAKPKVEAAWKLAKGRELAAAAAAKLSAEAKALKGDVQKLRDLAALRGVNAFEVGPLALRNPELSPTARTQRGYKPFSLPEDKVSFPGTLADDLIKLRTEAVGATAVAADQPKGRYYVAALLEKSEPSADEFRRSYVQGMENAIERDPLLNELAQAKRNAFRRDLLAQLRAEAKVTINEKARGREREQPAEE